MFVSMPEWTGDHTFTLWHAETEQHYHNRAGAYEEALRHYVEPSGLLSLVEHANSPLALKVFDPFFGLGYNSFVLMDQLVATLSAKGHDKASISPPVHLHIVAAETDFSLRHYWSLVLEAPRFNHGDLFKTPCEHNLYYQTLMTPFEICLNPLPQLAITLQVWFEDMRNLLPVLEANQFDAIFHDPFSQKTMPELWTKSIFQEYQSILDPVNGKVLTYSTARTVKDNLEASGFVCVSTPPLGGKRGGTMAVRSC